MDEKKPPVKFVEGFDPGLNDRGNRDEKGRFGPGNAANPGGRTFRWKEYKQWIEAECLPLAQKALLSCLESDSDKVRMMAVKEVHDRIFGRAPLAVSVTGSEGNSIASDLLPLLLKLAEKKDG